MSLPHETSEWQSAVDLASRGLVQEAEDAFLRLAEENPDDSGIWRWLANVSPDLDRRISYMGQALALNPEDSATRAELHKELMRRGVLKAQDPDLAKARQFFRRAITVKPDDELARLWLVEVSEDLEERIEALEDLLELRPKDTSVRITLSRELATQGCRSLESNEKKLALNLFRRAHKLDPENPEALLQLAMDPKRELNERIEMLNKVLEHNPDSAPIRELWEDLTEQALHESSTLPINLCGVCGSAKQPGALDCFACGCYLSLFDLDQLLNNERLDRPKVLKSVLRLKEQLAVQDHWKVHKQLLLAYLNLGDEKNAAVEVAHLLDAIPMNEPERLEVEQVELFLQRSGSAAPQIVEQNKTTGHILVVDDSPTVRALVGATLEESEHRISFATTGMEALACLRKEVPDLVLLDIGMPNMDGYQLCRLIRQNPTTSDVTVIMLSARDGFYDQVKARMVGCQDYITKPFDPEQLQQRVQDWLEA